MKISQREMRVLTGSLTPVLCVERCICLRGRDLLVLLEDLENSSRWKLLSFCSGYRASMPVCPRNTAGFWYPPFHPCQAFQVLPLCPVARERYISSIFCPLPRHSAMVLFYKWCSVPTLLGCLLGHGQDFRGVTGSTTITPHELLPPQSHLQGLRSRK